MKRPISPYADCEMIPYKDKRHLSFRGEEFEYYYIGWKCPVTGEVFATVEQEDVAILQVYNQYRERHNIPYPNEIKETREAYGVSAMKMAQILGWGENQYRLYENGEMPNINNGKQLRAIQNPEVFCNYVDLSNLAQKDKDKIKEKAYTSIYASEMNGKLKFINEAIYGDKKDGRFEGYASKSLSKLKNVLLYFIGESNRMFQTQMNKLLFYADFLCYKELGHGITGLTYVAHNFGPVPLNWIKVFSMFDEVQNEVINCGNGNEGHILVSDIPFDEQAFTDKEKEILNRVKDKFINCTPTQISEISHEEEAWKDNIDGHKMIDYSYAFDLKTI